MEQLDDLAARHATHLYRYGTYTLNQILKILKKADSSLSFEIMDAIDSMTNKERSDFISGRFNTRRTKKLRDDISVAASEVNQAVKTISGANGKGLAGYEIKHAEKVLLAIPLGAAAIPLTESAIHKAAMSKPAMTISKMVAKSSGGME